jgi:hypothetical protein
VQVLLENCETVLKGTLWRGSGRLAAVVREPARTSCGQDEPCSFLPLTPRNAGGKVRISGCVVHICELYRPEPHSGHGHVTDNDEVWAMMREALARDPDLRRETSNLNPRMPLSRAVAEYVRLLRERVAATPDEHEAADRILGEMEQRGITDPDAFLDAVRRGEIRLPQAS